MPSLPNLTIAQLQYIDSVQRHPTWAEAAAGLGVTPSALSQGITELERRLGLPVFERTGRRRTLREDAGPLADYASRVLAQTADLADWAASRRAGATGVVRVGMIDVAAVHHYATVLADYRLDRPGIALQLVVAPSGALLSQLERHQLDLVVCVAPVDESRLATTPLLQEDVALYAPPAVTAGPPHQWGPWVCFPEGSQTRALIAAELAHLGAPFVVVAESHQPDVLAEMVRLGLGWAALPVVQAETQRPLPRARPEPILQRTIVAARRDDAIADPAVDALLTALIGSKIGENPGTRTLHGSSEQP